MDKSNLTWLWYKYTFSMCEEEKELSQFKQEDYSTQLLKMIKSQIPVMVYAQISTTLEDSIQKSFRKAYSLKRDHEDKAKDKDPPAGSDQGLKKRKTSKDVGPLKDSKSKELKSSSSKGTMSHSKSSGKSAQAEESVFETIDTEMPHNQGDDFGNTDDQPNVKAASKSHWFKKPERPPTPDLDWNDKKIY
nr:hypothetical protein [Tanacetum cinerariifolium]